jgi:alkanesulfonate monooxygenase SsuD/methylene tetrahydromethanopterin reductase-like flavin-dependent oxidoreductase (luciferase family)
MDVGVWIPNCRHLATPDIIRTTAVRAEQLGYDSAWVSDHVVVPRENIKNFGETIFDPLVTLGVGAGWVAAESAMLGVPFKERGAMTDEHLLAMQELWTRAKPSFNGRYTQFDNLVFEPKPVQQPHPPIWVGGHTKAALRRTVRFGAAWHPINRPVEELRAGRAEVARLAREQGKPSPALTLRNDIRILRAGESAPPSAHAGRVLAGEPPALVEQIQELGECGVEHLVLEFLAADGRELEAQMALFAERVRPQLP